jgi:hypothetical protein
MERNQKMNEKNFWTACLSGAVLTTLVSNIPFVDMVNLLCFAGFWGGAIFAVWLYRYLGGTVVPRQSIRIGLLTGLLAGVLGFALSFLGVSGLQGMMNQLGNVLPAEDLQGTESIPMWGALIFNTCGVMFNIVFGLIGGWLGGLLFRTDRTVQKGVTA